MKNIFTWLRTFFNKNDVQFLGILGEQNQSGVHDFEEVVAKASEPVWVEKKPNEWRTFLPQYQYSSSSCVAFTIAKIAQILYYLKFGRKIKFSAGWIYKQRTPKVEGMWIDNAVSIAGSGLPTEELYPSEGLTEEQMNSLPDVPYGEMAKEFAISTNWVNMPLDFDTVASTIQKTQKGIMLWFKFGAGEWFRQSIPYKLNVYQAYAHSVTAVDAVLYNGKQYIVIEDSAEKDGVFGVRKLISRDFFSRCFLARYPLAFKWDISNLKPKYDGSIVSLQDCLKYNGFFPSNVPSSGYFGSITIEAVKRFQEANNIQQTGNVGPITRQVLLEQFN